MSENQSQINITETELFEKIISKIDKMKEKIVTLRDYTVNFDNNKELKYLEKLNSFVYDLNNLYACSKDIYDEFIIQSDPTLLSEQDLIKHKNLLINKKIQNIFLPYMLYLQIILQNNSE
jgi:hypothetical protein